MYFPESRVLSFIRLDLFSGGPARQSTDTDKDAIMEAPFPAPETESGNESADMPAQEAGPSPVSPELQRLRDENARLLLDWRLRADRQRAKRQLQQWYGEAQLLCDKYPDFRLEIEVRNPLFLSLLRAGISFENAYKVIHLDEIVAEAMRSSAADAERAVVDNVRAKGSRPRENGTAAQSAFTVKGDVSRLTRKERAEIARRSLRGETVRF